MKIMGPVNSYVSAVMQIGAGADEIYVGLKDDSFQNITFTGRGKVSNTGLIVQPDEKEFERIVKYARERGVMVNLTANIQLMADSNSYGMVKRYLDFVKKGITLGADQIIVGDIGNILTIRENNIDAPIVASTFLSIFNIETIKFFEQLEVKRIVLPHQITLDEMVDIKSKTNLEIEAFVGVGCSNIEGSCHMIHNCGEDIEIGLPCKSLFNVLVGGQSYDGVNFLDASLDCALCSLDKMVWGGIDVIKIVGRDQDVKFTSAITNIHKKCLDVISSNGQITKNEIDDILDAAPWWKENFCNKCKCKYENGVISDCYV